jgi:hypothetical protein
LTWNDPYILDIPPIRFVFQVTQEDLISSLMMTGYCQNMWEPVYRTKEWYKSVHSAGLFKYSTKIQKLQQKVPRIELPPHCPSAITALPLVI